MPNPNNAHVQAEDRATLVVLLCHGPDDGHHRLHFASRCHRVTPEELTELFHLSLVRLRTVVVFRTKSSH